MNAKKAKKIRKVLGYDVKKERQYFNLVSKTEKDVEGNDKFCGTISDQGRRAYQAAKKYI